MENRVRELISKSGLPALHQSFLSEWVVHQHETVVSAVKRNGDILDRSTHAVWLDCRRKMKKVVRWSGFVKRDGVWRQNTLQHTDSVSMFAEYDYRLLRPHLGTRKLETNLVFPAFRIHDAGEGLLKSQKGGKEKFDVMLNFKTVHDDVAEYAAFVRAFKKLHGFFDLYRPAYLLQHCLDSRDKQVFFPLEAQLIMLRIMEENKFNAWFFKSHEWLDYLWYAVWQFVDRGNRNVIANVMRNVEGQLNRVVEQGIIPLEKTFWTPEYIGWCREAAKGGDPNPPAA